MKHNIFISIFVVLFFSLQSFADNKPNQNKPYVVLLSPTELNQVRVNIEDYEPNNKDVKKFEVNFGDGVKVTNKKDIFHKYLANGNYTLTVKTWDNKNVVTTYTQSLDINTAYQVRDITNSTVLGPIDIRDEKKYKFNLTSTQAQRLYKVTVTKNSQEQNLHSKHFDKKCKRDYNVEINDLDIFKEDEINCRTTQIEKFAWLSTSNTIRLEADEPRWRSTFKVKINAVEIIKNLDTEPPILSSNVNSNSLTNSNKVHISVTDASSVTTYIWNDQQQLLGTMTDKEFDLTLSEGLNNFVLQSVDASNNRSAYFYLSNIKLDTVLPNLSTTLASQYIYSSYPQNFTLTITSDEDLQFLTVNNFSATMLSPKSFSYIVQVNQPQTLTFNIKGIDLAGNEKIITQSVQFGVDNIAPSLSSSLTTNSYTKSNSLQINISDNSNTETEVYSSGNLIFSTSNKIITLSLTEGSNNFVIKSIDQYGNQAQELVLNNIVLDTAAPNLSSNLNSSYLFSSLPQDLSVRFTANENLQYAEIDGSQVSIVNSTQIEYVKPITSAGNQSINIKIRDLAGNEKVVNFNFNIILDNIKPVLTIADVPALTNLGSVTVGFSVVDIGSTTTTVKLNGQDVASVQEKNFSYVLALSEGVNTIEAVSVDQAGNVSVVASKQIVKDSQSPILSEIIPLEAYRSNSLNVSIAGKSSEALKSVTVNGLEATLSEDKLAFNLDIVFSVFGQKIITIVATDLANNVTTETRNILLKDLEAPSITTNLSNGYMTYDLISINATGDDITNLRVLINDLEVFNEQATSYSTSFIYGQGVEHKIDIYATNARGQEAHSSYISILDSQAPFINVFNFVTQTTENFVKIDYNYYDVSPSTIRVFVDQQKVFESSENVGSFDVPLLTDGEHIVSVTAIDAAGNMSEPFTFNVYRDSTAPVITLVSPQNGDYVDGTGFDIKFKVDDQQVIATVNGFPANWNSTEQIWEARLFSVNTDEFEITYSVANQVGLITEKKITVKPLLSPLVSDLIGLYEDNINSKMIIRGADGATRPNLILNVKTSFFSSTQVQADAKGAFVISLAPKDEYTVYLTDPATGFEYQKKLTRYHQDVILSGRVKDNKDQPLSGVIINLAGMQTQTDENGVFSFNASDFPDTRITGDHKINIDGSFARAQGETRAHNFSSTTMNVSLSYKINNIIQDTIYLYPTYSDVEILNPFQGGTFTSADAPGVSLTTGADIIPITPNGASVISVPINMYTVSPDKLSIKPPHEAMPEQVLVLEPSGTVFLQGDVQLTVPNYSSFPAKTNMILMLFNSSSGRWEVGGAGQVTEDGQSVVTKPDQGLRHFSDAYFIPTPADILAMNVPDKPGADSFSGAVTNKIDIPEFKVLGQTVSPSLIYKSTWAKPSTTITNIFNFSEKVVQMSPYTESGSVAQAYAVDVIRCSRNIISENLDWLFFPAGPMLTRSNSVLDPAGYNRAKEAAIRDMQEKQMLPKNCSAVDKQEFYRNYDYTNTFSDLQTTIKPQMVEMSLQYADVQLEASKFKNLPAMAQLSKFVNLKNSQNQYLASGMYPYVAKYKVFYDKLVTGTVKTDYVDKITGAGSLSPKPIDQRSSYLEDPSLFFGSDLIENIFVQNYRQSEAGQGWKLAGTQKIVNPSAQKIMLEEADGSVSTYSVQNSIVTAADLSVISSSADISKGISLNQWPNFTFTDSDNKTIKRASWNGSAYTTNVIGEIPDASGKIYGYTNYNWTEQGEQYLVRECVERIATICIRFQDNYFYRQLPRSTCKTNSYPYKQSAQVVQYLDTANGTYLIDSIRNNLSYVESNQYRDLINQSVLMSNVKPRIQGFSRLTNINDPFSTEVVFDYQLVDSYISQSPGMSLTAARTVLRDDTYTDYNSCGDVNANVPISEGNIYNGGSSFSNVIVSNDPNVLILANNTHSLINTYNLATAETKIVAGNQANEDNGDNGLAINASIYKPRGLAQDSSGNLYISTSLGHIRKIDSEGTITTIAGNPDTGTYSLEGPANKFKFNNPYGLAIDEQTNSLFVADTGYNRVVKIDLSEGFVTTVAGNGQSGFSGDGGAAVDASLSAPTFLHIDSNRNLIIVDSGNNKIRKVTLNSPSNNELSFVSTKEDNSKLTKKSDGTWERKYRNGQKELFDSFGRHVASVSTNGLNTNYEYSGEKLSKVKFANGDEVNYVYSGDKLSYILDPSNKRTNFDYNYLGQLTKVIYPDNSQKQFEYDAEGLMIREINQKGFMSHFIYNAYDRLQRVELSDNSQIKIADSASKGLEQVDVSGVFVPSNSYTSKDSITDANNNKIQMVKDTDGYIATITDPKGRQQVIKRDNQGRPIKITDVDGTILQNKYDEVYGDLIESKNVTLDITSKTAYNIYGQVISETDPFNKTNTKEYNSKLQLVKQTTPDGKYVTYEYNSLSLVTKKASYSAANELKNQIIYEYNSKGQLIKQIDLNNKFASYTYDNSGNVLSSTSNIDSNTTATTFYEYDQMNRLLKVTSPKNEVTEYTYSLAGELLQIKDPQNKITSFEYNAKGELIRKTDPAGLVHEMTYDKNGNVLTEKDPAGQIKSYVYNEINKVTQVNTADDQINYQYNIKDEVQKITNNTSEINYVRDAKQRITQETVSGINYPQHAINFDYTKNDLRIALSSNYQNIGYGYNPDSYQLTSINSSATGSYGFSYDEASRLVQVARPGSVTNYSFDVGSSLTKISHQKNNVEIGFHEYSYDLRNYITQKRSPASTLSYGYDSNGQLISSNKTEDSSQNESFSYDALGNRLTYNGVSSSFDNSGQRIQDDGQYTYVYDLSGNVIYKSSKSNGVSYTFEYSALNQLKKATVTSSPLGGSILKEISYKYDPVGRRILREVTDNVDSSKSKTQKYYYDGSNILAELDADNNLVASYTHSPLRADDILGARFTSSAVNQGLAESAGYAYYLKDHLNSVNEITNANGDVIQKMDYSAFGVLRSVKNDSDQEVGFNNAPIKTSFTYTGREFEPELNMYYYRARYYDASTGRFLQTDPDPGKLAQPNTFLSKYIYAANSPIMFSDPSGRWIWLVIIAAGVLNGLIQGGINSRDTHGNGAQSKEELDGMKNNAFLTGFVSGFFTGAITAWAPGAGIYLGAVNAAINTAVVQGYNLKPGQSINWGGVLISAAIGGLASKAAAFLGDKSTYFTKEVAEQGWSFVLTLPSALTQSVVPGPYTPAQNCNKAECNVK